MYENPLKLLMNPRSVAVVGASNDYTKMGTIQSLSIIKDGYAGKFYPISLKEKTVLGYPAFKAVADLPEVPDLAVLIVPSRAIINLIEDFGRIGTKRAVIVTAGFREIGASGRVMEDELNAVAAQYGMRFVGPNCLGIINSEFSLNTTVAPFTAGPGLLGFASQSGTYVTQVLPYLKKRGIRFSKAISLGNEANIDVVDALEYLGEDEQTKAVILYIEGIRDAVRFVEVARRITKHKPVLAKYVGGSVSGARAGASHTGAMAGPDFLYDGIFRQAGIIRVHTIEDLYAHGWTLATQPPLRGNRVGILTNSGGPGSSMAYTCDAVGLSVPRFSDALQAQIKPLIEAHAPATNPVDLTFDLGMDKLSTTLPQIILKSGEVDALLLHGVMHSGFMREVFSHVQDFLNGMSYDEFMSHIQPVAKEAFELPQRFGLPFLVSTFFDAEDAYAKGYMDADIPVFFTPENTARALGSMYRYAQIQKRRDGILPALPEISKTAEVILQQAKTEGYAALDEFEAKAVLAAYGVPVTREIRTCTKSKTVEAAESLRYPVAVKVCSRDILHKSGQGLLALNLQNASQVKKAFDQIQKVAGRHVPVLVSEMVSGEREFLAGMTRFDGFGPLVVFGLGGVLTEIHHDTALRQVPLSDADALEMFDEIRSAKLLGAYRGMTPVSTDALVGLLQTLGHIALLHPEISEIDLNPIIISAGQPVVADALIGLQKGE